MFAIIKTGGKQYKVSEGTILKLEKIEGDAGTTVSLQEVLACGDSKSVKIGSPLVKGASVDVEILEQKKDKKVLVFKKKRRHNYRRKKGHRQEVTIARVVGIKASAPKAAAPKAETATKKAAPKKATTATKKPAAKKPAAKKEEK